jgi:hypothetical protein
MISIICFNIFTTINLNLDSIVKDVDEVLCFWLAVIALLLDRVIVNSAEEVLKIYVQSTN